MSSPRTARGNRVGLALVGVVLLAAGAWVTARAVGVSGLGPRHEALLSAPETRTLHADGWIAPVAAVVAALVALACLRWLLVQFRSDSVRSIALEPDDRRGATVLDGGAVAAAVQHEIAGYPDVVAAHAALAGRSRSPELHLGVTVNDGRAVSELRRRIRTEAVAHAREALGRPAIGVLLEITVR